MKRLREVTLLVLVAVAVLDLARHALEPERLEAGAIPKAQADVDTNVWLTSQKGFWLVLPNSSVTFNNGTATRKVIITFSAETAVTNNGLVELGYALTNGGGAQCFPQAGPKDFATNAHVETKTAVHVPTLGPGTWTILPCVRLSGPSAVTNTMFFRNRTLTVEKMTS